METVGVNLFLTCHLWFNPSYCFQSPPKTPSYILNHPQPLLFPTCQDSFSREKKGFPSFHLPSLLFFKEGKGWFRKRRGQGWLKKKEVFPSLYYFPLFSQCPVLAMGKGIKGDWRKKKGLRDDLEKRWFFPLQKKDSLIKTVLNIILEYTWYMLFCASLHHQHYISSKFFFKRFVDFLHNICII